MPKATKSSVKIADTTAIESQEPCPAKAAPSNSKQVQVIMQNSEIKHEVYKVVTPVHGKKAVFI